MSASGSVENAKTFPAATLDDQEAILNDKLGEATVLGPPAFSSPDPATDGNRMLPLEDGSSAHQAAVDAADARGAAQSQGYKSMKVDELRKLAEEREVDVEGMKKDEIVAALQEDDASGMNASDFKALVSAATTQEELDAAAEQYENSGKEYSSVESAIEKRQTELDDEQ